MTWDEADPEPDLGPVSESELAEAARRVADNPDVQNALQSVVDLAMALRCLGASVTLVGVNGGAETTATSIAMIERADNLQYTFDEGPCLRAAETGRRLSRSSRPRPTHAGPRGARRWRAMGLHSVLSIHLFTDARVLGALNLYYASVADFTDDEVETARMVAAHASVALARLRSERDLWRAIDSRHLIGQAQGILMERFQLSPEKAFAVLRRHSQQYNIKLHAVAAELVRTGRLPIAQTDRPDRTARTGQTADRPATGQPG